MKRVFMGLLLSGLIVLGAAPALAEDIEGRITAIDADAQSFVVQGITFYATQSTDYDDGLRRFADLQVGQKVEVDFDFRDNRHYATEIEFED